MTQPARLVHPLSALTAGAEVIGSRGAGLSRLARSQLPIAPGFVVGTAAWHLSRLTTCERADASLAALIDLELEALELRTGRSLDDPTDPAAADGDEFLDGARPRAGAAGGRRRPV